MKKKYIPIIIVTAIAVIGCEPQGFEPENDGKVISIAVKEAVYVSSGTPSMQLSLKDNAELQLNVSILPQNARKKDVVFSNQYPQLLEVTETGLLKGKAPGTDTLTVSATDGSGISTRFVVNIIDHLVKATAINVTAGGSEMELKEGGNSFDLSACVTIAPADTWDSSVTYTSNDESVATVNSTGIVTPVTEGSTTITIRTTDGSNLSKNCNVVVKGFVIRYDDFASTNWTVTTVTATNYIYVPDGSTGKPEDILTESTSAFLSLVKPGKENTTYSIPLQAADFMPGFTVDMKSLRTFDYFKWRHRGNNAYNTLRVYAVDIYGSNDGNTFTQINTTGKIWIPNAAGYEGQKGTTDTTIYTLEIPESTYQFVRVRFVMWSDTYNGQHPDYPGAGSTASGALQLSGFWVGKIHLE